MNKIALISLGCSKNTVDSETMLGALDAAGLCVVSEPEDADAVVINTCGFIEASKKEGIEQILAAVALKNEGRVRAVIVTGCLSQRYRAEIEAAFPEVDAFLGTTSESAIVSAVNAALAGERFTRFDGENDPPFFGRRLQSTPFYTAYLKIAEGCNNRCSYCAIPLIRGRQRSIPIGDLVAQATELAQSGVKELIVIAQDTTAYGTDLACGIPQLTALLPELCKIGGIRWIRLLYCYPERITDALLTCIRDNPKVLPYFDIPIQHADRDILKAMRRPGDYESLLSLIKKIRTVLPAATLRTTLIVGFPGETERQFETLCRFIKEARFDKLGAFAYSPEEGTEAASLPDQIPESVKAERLDAVMSLQQGISAALLREKIGGDVPVLVEDYDEEQGLFIGRTAADAPDIDGRIFLRGEGLQQGDIVLARVTGSDEYDLSGELL